MKKRLYLLTGAAGNLGSSIARQLVAEGKDVRALVLKECIAGKVCKLVYVGSTGAIPELPKGRAIAPVDHYDPNQVVGFYGKTKAEASQIVLDAVRERGLDASIVCPTGIAGSFNAADVRDLAAETIACCDKGRKGESYILGNECVSMGDMFKIVSTASGVKEVKTILPVWLAKP